MFRRLFTAARGAFAALLIASAVLGFAPAAFAEDSKPADKPAGQEPAKELDQYAEAQKEIAGPAGNPECVRLGQTVIALLWRDDLDTAFRHLDLYDRFGCPSAHIQASFRCLILHGSGIDPKASDKLVDRAHACWINPANPAPPPASAAAAPPANPPAKN
jgi:hypothetical protein